MQTGVRNINVLIKALARKRFIKVDRANQLSATAEGARENAWST
jgi:hypothetical protein